jgi:hypothetical protein
VPLNAIGKHAAVNYIRHLNAFFQKVKTDDRLTAVHVSLYLALFQYWNLHRFSNPFPVYRDNIMALSRIGSKNTYHKAIKQLVDTGYILYHPAPAPYLPARISVNPQYKRPTATPGIQLELFQNPDQNPSLPLYSGPSAVNQIPLAHVPDLTTTSPTTGTPQVSLLGQSFKQTNSPNSVYLPPTVFRKEERGKERKPGAVSVSKPVPGPVVSLADVQTFFTAQGFSAKEAERFFYYNQSRSWMLTEKLPVSNWQALAHKWMLNTREEREGEKGDEMALAIQYLYERYREGEKIAKFLLPEFFDYLHLTLTDAVLQKAWQQRINQLSGSPVQNEQQLWKAYMAGDPQHEAVIHDRPLFISLAKRIAVHQFFQKCKAEARAVFKTWR